MCTYQQLMQHQHRLMPQLRQTRYLQRLHCRAVALDQGQSGATGATAKKPLGGLWLSEVERCLLQAPTSLDSSLFNAAETCAATCAPMNLLMTERQVLSAKAASMMPTAGNSLLAALQAASPPAASPLHVAANSCFTAEQQRVCHRS